MLLKRSAQPFQQFHVLVNLVCKGMEDIWRTYGLAWKVRNYRTTEIDVFSSVKRKIQISGLNRYQCFEYASDSTQRANTLPLECIILFQPFWDHFLALYTNYSAIRESCVAGSNVLPLNMFAMLEVDSEGSIKTRKHKVRTVS